MKFVKGNILDAEYGIIGHQVNCQLVMGAGLAKQIRAKYPKVFTEYVEVMGMLKPEERLGKCQMVEVIPQRLLVANLFGQMYYGRNKRYTDYNALSMALVALKAWHVRNVGVKDFPIYLPHGIGCNLAGGDWEVVKGLIGSAIPDAIVVRYEG